MRLRTKLILAFLAVSALTVVLGFVSVYTYATVGAEITLLSEDAVPGAVSMLETEAAMGVLSRELQEFLRTGGEEHKEHMDVAIARIRGNTREYTEYALQLGAEEGAAARDIEERASSIISLSDRALASESEAETAALISKLGEESGGLGEIMEEHVADNLSELDEAVATVTNAQRTGMMVVWAVGVIAVVASVGLGIFLARMILLPVYHLIAAAESISRGDLDVPIEVKTGDELEDLAGAIERMRASLKAAIERLRR